MSPYQRYLQSDHWKQLRDAKLKACGSSCNRCTSTNDIQVHHVYYKKSWWECELADLEVLCRECHEKAHRIQKKALKKVFIKYKNFHAFDHAFRRCDTRICARY